VICKKKSIFIILFSTLGLITRVGAQSDLYRIKLGFNASIGKTTNNSPFGYGLGLDVIAKYQLSEELTAVVGVGYGRLLTKDTSPIPDYDFIPVKASIKVFPFIPYIYLNGIVGTGFGLRKDAKPAFIFGGGAGYEWKKTYDFSIRYEAYQQSRKSTTYQPLNGQFAMAFAYYFNSNL
jgi:hypothetical protein